MRSNRILLDYNWICPEFFQATPKFEQNSVKIHFQTEFCQASGFGQNFVGLIFGYQFGLDRISSGYIWVRTELGVEFDVFKPNPCKAGHPVS